MILFREINKMMRIHSLIKRHATGSPSEFAKKMSLSRRQLFYLLEYFKDIGAEIKYNRYRQTYYYNNSFDFEIKVFVNGNEEFLS